MIRNDRLYKVDMDMGEQPIGIEQIISGEITYGGGGGGFNLGGGGGGGSSVGGGSVSVGGGSNIILTDAPNTAISNQNLILNILSNEVGGYIYIDGVNTYKTTNDKVQISLKDLLINGNKKITVVKDGYTSPDEYLISFYANPTADIGFNLNIGSSIFGGMSGNTGVSGLDLYRSLPSFNSNSIPYSDTKYYNFKVTHYKNSFEQAFTQSNDNSESLQFTLTAIKPDPTPVDDTKIISVVLDGPDGSVSLIINGTLKILNVGTNNIAINLGDKLSISTSDLNSYRIKTIQLSKDSKSSIIDARDSFESVSSTIDVNTENLSVSILSEKARVDTGMLPSISLDGNETIRYNINTKTDIPVRILKNSGVTGIKLSIANNKYNFTDLGNGSSFVLLIPAKAISIIGNYKCIVVPFNASGDGQPIQFNVNVVDEVFVGVPDIRNISYPSLIKGPDFKGADVDFIISYDSINTDYVRIYKEGSDSYIKATKAGDVNLNFLNLLKLDSTKTSENEDLVSINLILVPYNEQGKEVIKGKTETITIQLDKGDLSIPRDVAVSRIADGFISQFDDSIFEDETSKYLTHFLHLGDGNNKVITTWTGSLGSLILKLYEPLDTNVQPNQQVWISKLQANPIIETITISGFEEGYCTPLKGPNFSIEPDNGFGWQIYSDLIASGSNTSTDLINRYLSTTGVDTSKLNIQYVSGSDYIFENFSNFGSAEERINNFFYKVQLIETYKTKYEQLIADTFIPPYGGFNGGMLTEDGYQQITEDGVFDIQWEIFQYKGTNQKAEAKKYYDALNEIIRAFDGYEKWLYTSSNDLAYPKQLYIHPITGLGTYILKATTDNDVVAWYESLVDLSYEYDKLNPNLLSNNIPEFIKEDYTNEDFIVFLNMIGQHFDILWAYINSIKNTKVLEEKQTKGISNELVKNLLQSFGWENKKAFNSPLLWEYAFGTDKDGFQKYGISLEEANNQVWRRILNNLPYILKHKGTGRAMKAIMACYGVPQSMLTIMEFGGPQDPTKDGSSKFTFDDRTAAFYLSGSLNTNGSSNIKVPWKSVNGSYPDCIEFSILPGILPNPKYSLVSGSEWSLDLVQTTGSFAKLELNFGGELSNSTYFEVTSSGNEYITSSVVYVLGPDYKTGSLDFPISTEHYSNIAINRHNNPDSSSWFEVWLATSNGSRIITSVSMSIATLDSQWETGSNLQIGGNGFQGNLDEFRLWRVPLQRSKFENHTLHPNAINGNSYTSSTEDLYFRLDFEYPKDRISDPLIKNVSITDNYGENYASASNMYSAPTYPYQYIPYDRTVTATVPSLGLTYANKIRFEEQELITDLSYKKRATKKSFDRAPIDSNRLGLFFSPIKELNMDILKTFGDFNIDNYIGDPSDEYKENYKELDKLRHYYFERLQNRDIYEYINLVRYIDKSLFEVLTDLAPARAKVSKGLLIEPHYLERSKTQWSKPIAQNEYNETLINYDEIRDINSELESRETLLNTSEHFSFDNSISNNETLIDAEKVYTIESLNEGYDTKIDYFDNSNIVADAPFYETAIQVPTGSYLSGEAFANTLTQIGMEKDSLANAGFGLYAINGVGIVKKWDGVFGNNQVTGSRSSIFLVKEQKTKKVSTQISGYPTGSGPVIYKDIKVNYNTYKVSVQPYSGSVAIGNDVVNVVALNGYFPTHYRYKNNLSLGMQQSYWNGSLQTAVSTPDGLSPVETFTTNPNILKVAKTGRGSGEPILEVD